MGERIRGKVAELIDDRTLVINRGTDDGVGVGMRFAVLNRKGAEVVDPETRESLGSVEIEKVVVKVVSVHPKFAVAKTFRTFSRGFGAIFDSGVERETLRLGDKTYKMELDEEDSLVKIGDPVVQAVGDEFDDSE